MLALVSGGGSSLLTLPRPPLALDDLIAVNRLLLSSGLSISEMNKVRRRLSQVKGGGLARAAGQARLVTLAISDVPGDDPGAIASGPTVPDPTAREDLSHLVAKLGGGLPEAVAAMLRAPSPDAADFTPDYRLIATPQGSLTAAAEVARAAGVTPVPKQVQDPPRTQAAPRPRQRPRPTSDAIAPQSRAPQTAEQHLAQ